MNLIDAEKAVFAAVKSHFVTANLDDAGYAGPYRDVAPDPVNAPSPYVTVSFDPDGRVETTSEGIIAELMYRLKVFDRNLTLVDAHCKVLAEAYKDDTPLSLTTGDVLLYRVQNGGSMEEDKRTAQGWLECRLMYWVPRG